jgi:hypothetical protein
MLNIDVMSALQDRRVQIGLAAVGLFFVALILADCDTSRSEAVATTHTPATVTTVNVSTPTQDEDTLEIVVENTDN